MNIYHGFDNLPDFPKGCVTTIGSFDGVHHGHRLLIGELGELARARGHQGVVVTFDPHPRQVLRGENRLLSTIDEKLVLLAETGIENVVVVNFTREFSQTPYNEFIDEFIVEKLNTKILVIGESNHFGKNRGGSVNTLNREKFDIHRVIRYHNISSTQIRTLVEQGDMAEANSLLGTKGYLIETPVKDDSKLLPPPGEYTIFLDGGVAKMTLDKELLKNDNMLLRVLDKS